MESSSEKLSHVWSNVRRERQGKSRAKIQGEMFSRLEKLVCVIQGQASQKKERARVCPVEVQVPEEGVPCMDRPGGNRRRRRRLPPAR